MRTSHPGNRKGGACRGPQQIPPSYSRVPPNNRNTLTPRTAKTAQFGEPRSRGPRSGACWDPEDSTRSARMFGRNDNLWERRVSSLKADQKS
jgi:hypothetical protein